MVAFHVVLPQGTRLGLEERKQRLLDAGYVLADGRLEKPGFETPEVIGGALCVRYWEEDRRVLEYFGEQRIEPFPLATNFYDLLGERREGYILVGKAETEDALQAVALYLRALGLEEGHVVASPLGVAPDQMKQLFFDERVIRRRIKAWGLTQLTIGTSLPDLTLDKYYQKLEEAGLNDEPWQACEFIPPALPPAGKSPPMIHLRSNGFTVRSSYQEAGNWHYVDWLLKALEQVAHTKPIAKNRFPSLFDFPDRRRAPTPPKRHKRGGD